MAFKVKKTKKQRILGALSLILFLFVAFCIIYFLTYFFTLPSTTHEGQKIIESDWYIELGSSNEYVYAPEQGIKFTFKDNGRFSIEYEDGEKIASGFYKIKLDDDTTEGSSGTIKLLTVPFMQNFPKEWGFGELRNDLLFSFEYTKKDKDGIIIYKDKDNNVMSDVMKITTDDSLFTIVREGSEDFALYTTSNKTSTTEE